MANTKTILERSPFYAFLGAADAAFENVRSTVETATGNAASLRDELTPEQVQQRILGTVGDVRDQIAALPALATERYESVSGNVQRAYEDFANSYLQFAERGVELSREVTNQGLSAVTAAREAARDNTFSAVLDVRKEAAKGVERLAGLAGRGADVVEAEAETTRRSAAAKQGAAKRPSRKAVAKKVGAGKTTAKSAATKSTAKKSTAKKSTAKKAPAKKTTAKKAPAKKVTPANVESAPTLPVEAKADDKA